MKPKTLGNKPTEIVTKDLGYVSQIFLPKTMGNDPKPCGLVYVIAPAAHRVNTQYGIYLVSRKQHEIFLTHFLCSSVLVIFEKARILYNKNQNKND